MVPRIHPKGHSFKGCAQYLLHDKDADTSDRVAWVETRNLAVEDPQIAWRLMAATAKDQARLKQEAGIKNTGRKSNLHVLHFSLGWHPDEADDLDPSQMLAAAEAVLSMMGAEDHQAMIVCHSDEPHPHVHVMVNRVGYDGRMLSSSFEKLKTSQWAQKYEEQRGKIFCHERVINNAARDRGEYVRGTPAKARNVYEAELRRPVNDNTESKQRAEQRRRHAELAKRGRLLEQKQKEAWARLEHDHKQRISTIRQEIVQAISQGKERVREDYRPRWAELHHQHQAEMRAFEQRETSMMGRIQNRFQSLNFGRMVSGEEKGKAVGEAFGAMTSRASRLEIEKKKQQQAENTLQRQQQQAEQEAVRQERLIEQQRLSANRRLFIEQRHQVMLEHSMAQAKHRAEWLQRNQEQKLAHQYDLDPTKQTPQDRAETPQQSPLPLPSTDQDNTPATKPGDLLPKKEADKRSKQIDQYQDLVAKRLARKRKQKRDRERGDQDRGR